MAVSSTRALQPPRPVVWARAAERFGVVTAAVLVGGVLRFWSLDGRGYWRDEIFTVDLVRLPFTRMLHAIPRSEGTPPAYYAAAWAWARLFGTSEAGLRSLSALVGTLTVAAVYFAAARFFDRRTAFVAGFITATSPLMVWYGQEARSYAFGLLAVAVSLSALAVAAAPTRSSTAIWVWAAFSALALATHYFTAFAILPEALWLLATARRRDRRVVPAVALVGASGLALVPLALAQRGNPAWIGGRPLLRRLIEVPSVFLAGPQPSVALLAVPLGLIALVAIVLVLAARSTAPARRRRMTLLVGIGAAVIVLPLALALGGVDFFLARNVIFAWPALVVVLAAALTSGRLGRTGLVGAVVFIGLGAAVVIATAAQPKYGSEDWRGAAAELAHTHGPRVVALSPLEGEKPFRYYLGRLQALRTRAVLVREIDLVGLPGPVHAIGEDPRPPNPAEALHIRGFHLVLRDADPTYSVVRLRAPRPTVVSAARLRALALGRPVQLLDGP
jgi:mannosyltransferase